MEQAAQFFKNGSKNGEKILVHACCAVCFAYPSQFLRLLNYTPVAYFSNPNIYPNEEYQRRLEELVKFCEKYHFELIIENDEPETFYKAVLGLEDEPEKGLRCVECFKLRLKNAALKAKELDIKYFTTTLSVSPHKNFEIIKNIGSQIAKEHEIIFEPYDFKKNNGYNMTRKIANFNNMYKQNYCGCKFALRPQ